MTRCESPISVSHHFRVAGRSSLDHDLGTTLWICGRSLWTSGAERAQLGYRMPGRWTTGTDVHSAPTGRDALRAAAMLVPHNIHRCYEHDERQILKLDEHLSEAPTCADRPTRPTPSTEHPRQMRCRRSPVRRMQGCAPLPPVGTSPGGASERQDTSEQAAGTRCHRVGATGRKRSDR